MVGKVLVYSIKLISMKSFSLLIIFLIVRASVIQATVDSVFFSVNLRKKNVQLSFEKNEFDIILAHYQFKDLPSEKLFHSYDHKGLKHGFWLLMIDSDLRITKNEKKCSWIKIEPYWHGRRMSPSFEQSFRGILVSEMPMTSKLPKLLCGKLVYQKNDQIICSQRFVNGFAVDTLKYYRKDHALSYMYVTDLSDSIYCYEVLQMLTECGTFGVHAHCKVQNHDLVLEEIKDVNFRRNSLIILVETDGMYFPQSFAEV